jgi:hypothetical protein
MMIQLSPDKIGEQWAIIQPAIEAVFESSGIPMTNAETNNILQGMIAGRIQCFVNVVGEVIKSIMVTYFTFDPRGTKSLLIYSLYGYVPTTDSEWKDVYDYMKKWAVSNGCVNITAYTQNNRILDIVKKLGGRIESFITLGIGGGQ